MADAPTDPYFERVASQRFGDVEDMQFPSRDVLASYAGRDGTGQLTTVSNRIEHWPSPVDLPSTDKSTAIDDLIVALIGDRAHVRRTAGLDCAAREIAKTLPDELTAPDIELRQYLASRCGSPAVELTVIAYDAAERPNESMSRMTARIAPELRTQLPTEFNAIGTAWLEAEGGRRVLVVVTGNEYVRPLRSSRTGGGKFAVQGKLLIPARRLVAVSTYGDYGVAECRLDRSVPLPDFSFVCSGPRISLVALGKAGELGSQVLHWTAGDKDFRRTKLDSAERSLDLLALINLARSRVSRPALRTDIKQSASARPLVRPFFVAKRDRDRKTASVISRGLMAGWDFDGHVGRAWFLSGLSSLGTTDDVLFASMWSDPLIRWQLLRSEVDTVALATHTDAHSIATTIVLYSTLDAELGRKRFEESLAAVDDQRAAAGKHRIDPWVDAQAVLDRRVEGIALGKVSSQAALESSVRNIREHTGQGALGHVVVSTDARSSGQKLPEKLTADLRAKLAWSLAIECDPTRPWCWYVLFLVIHENVQQL